MLGQIFSAFGGAIGDSLGGGVLSNIGRLVGRYAGDYIEHSSLEIEEFYKHRKHLDQLYLEADTEGKVIPMVFGYTKVHGQMIWATPLHEVKTEEVAVKKFRNTDIERAIYHDTSYTYYANFALGICAGEITDIMRIWACGDIIDLSEYQCRIYKGTKDQLPDPLIENIEGGGKTPAFRDLAYIVFENFPLNEFGNRVPHFEFEVQRKCFTDDPVDIPVEDLVRDMVVIPGSGEFVYDTIVQQKISKLDDIVLLRLDVNSHNHKKVADSIFSLDQMQNTCPNVEWVAPVVCWFGNSTSAAECSIVPKVEYSDNTSTTSEAWNVAGYTRSAANVVSKDEWNSPQYGGTVNDASVLRYLDEIKRRNLKVMFYPMFFLDMPGKPWRGHLTGSPRDITEFFNKRDGYKRFILHYAQLVVGKVDAFVIGSELIGLTKVQDGSGNFPAVNELIDIAKKVKAILGPAVIVTYAADWSEYHHTDGGWYNLDPLWACPAIDVIGIDAYFPITNTTYSKITKDDIERGWSSGEGYDWYRDGDVQRPLGAAWAWKNIEYWWSNQHTNPNNLKTPWIPKSKKIWFTEYGFPSIDKASNQPNVFYNPACVDGAVPRHSNGYVNFAIQRLAIKASIEHFKNSPFLDRMFLWTWDARPYPAWPHGTSWSDKNLWSRGHWVNNKFGSVTLGNILIELCAKAGIARECIDVSNVDEVIGGFIIDQKSSILDIISMLRYAFCFDIVATDMRMIKFIKRDEASKACAVKIDKNDLVKRNDHSFFSVSRIATVDIPSRILLRFNNQVDYKKKTYYADLELVNYTDTEYLHLPVTMSEQEAGVVATNILKNMFSAQESVKLILPITYIFLEPTDIILIDNMLLRICAICIKGMALEIDALVYAERAHRSFF